MGSDRVRVSYDERRRWRSVVDQQGRVALEADGNEASQLAAEELRREALEVVGVTGTPDDGYKVIEPTAKTTPAFEVTVGKGTMYVGGVREHAYADILYSTQPEWLDHSTDPDWRDPAKPAGINYSNELICLLLREQEVGAVEDTALREVALGGPDTCQRTRLIQRILRLGINASTCEDAIKEAQDHWSQAGLQRDPASARLLAAAGLKVGFLSQGPTPDPCEPQAAGGYLKPDNQLIRIKVTSYNAAAGTGTFIWGYDDASFLYRVQVVDSKTLKLGSVPIDEFHKPRVNQAVEVLRTAAQLATGWDLGGDWKDGPVGLSADDYVASPDGIVQTLAKEYDPITGQVSLSPGLPLGYPPQPGTPVTFMRVWEGQVAFTLGTAASVGDTGMQVTLTLQDPKVPVEVGAYWMVGVRPGTPTKVYPQRYLDQPQPPDGPRLWVCPLAVVHWDNDGLMKVKDDCRNLFSDLVDLSKRFPSAPQTWNRIAEISWLNDWPLVLNTFNGGLRVTASAPVDARTLSENTFLVVLDISDGGIFRVPFEVRGVLQQSSNAFTFTPRPLLQMAEVQAWLNQQEQFEKERGLPITPGIRCRIALKGNAILDAKGNPLDGNVFGVVKQRGSHFYTDLALPYSGDGIKGGDFESWFFLTLPPQVKSINPSAGELFVVPNNPTAVEVQFSRAMDASTIMTSSFTVDGSVTGPVTGKVTNSSPTSAMFQPVDATGATIPFPGPTRGSSVTYAVRLLGNQIKDTYGLSLDGAGNGTPGTDYTTDFRLVAVLTRVASVNPPDSSSWRPGHVTRVVITFTGDVHLNLVNTTNFTVTDDTGTTLVGTIQPDPQSPPNRGVVFTPRGGFPLTDSSTIYTVVLAGSTITDTSGTQIDAAGNGTPGSTLTSTFTITQPKEKDAKDHKDHKDDKDDPDHRHAPVRPAGKVLEATTGLAREKLADSAPTAEPNASLASGNPFIRPNERPEVGGQALLGSSP